MSLVGWLYFVDLFKNVDRLLFLLGFFWALYIIVSLGWTVKGDSYRENVEREKFIYPKMKKSLWIPISLISISCLFPSTKTMYLMLGASYFQQSNLPSKVSQALELKLDDVIKELKEEKDA